MQLAEQNSCCLTVLHSNVLLLFIYCHILCKGILRTAIITVYRVPFHIQYTAAVDHSFVVLCFWPEHSEYDETRPL